MKKIYLLLILSLQGLFLMAEDKPFVYEGRTWEVARVNYSELWAHPLQWKYTYDTYFFEGDTVIGGHRCLNMYLNDGKNKIFVGSFYEEEKRVYWLMEGTTEGHLLYDFSLEKDSVLHIGGTFAANYKVLDVRYDSIYGYYGRVQYLINDDEMIVDYIDYRILEGIGSLQGPVGIAYWETADGRPDYLVKCTVDDDVVFTRDITPKVEDYLQEVPYLFEGDGNLYDDQEIWLLINWSNMPFAPKNTSYSTFTQQVDSIVGNKVYASHHFDSQTDFTNALMYDYGKYLNIGKLLVGEYILVLSAVDEQGEISLIPYEIPFTVISNTENKNNGFIHLYGEKHFRDDQQAKKFKAWHDKSEESRLHIQGFIYFDSQMEHYCAYSVQGDTIFLTAKQTGACSTDKGFFQFDFILDGFNEERCVLIVKDESGTSTYTFKAVNINLNEQYIADVLTPEVQANVTEIILSGNMTPTDYTFVNACPKLITLDMTDVITDSIPQFCLSKATSLADLYLPKKETVFNFYAVKNDITNSVTAHITGLFPDLDVPTTGDRLAATDVVFTVEKGNNRYYETEYGYIYSANMDTLYRFAQKNLDWETNVYAVVIRPNAFAWLKLKAGTRIEVGVYSELKQICYQAFEGIRFLPWIPYDPDNPDDNLDYPTSYYADLVIHIRTQRGKEKPQLEGPVAWNTEEYRAVNGSLVFFITEGSYKDYLKNSCLWAGTDMMDMDTYDLFDPKLSDTNPRYDKEGNLLHYVKPHIVSSEWHASTLNTENVTFDFASEDGSSVSTEMDVEYGAYYTFVYSWTMIERDYPNPLYPYFHEQEYRDTILSPIPEGDDLTYDFEIYDDEGNLLYSNKRRGNKGSTEHLSGTLTNVPQSQQGDLKSRTTGMRFGESPWKSQRVNFGVTGIRPIDAAPASNTYYDLTGRPASETRKGILIKNGKKVLVK